MGVARSRLERFKDEHPVCAFCAGERVTESIDHQPPRVFFKGKRFPDNIAVPACSQCQNLSRKAEAALSLLLIAEDSSDADQAAYRKRIADAERRFAELVPKPPASARDARKVMAHLGKQIPRGMTYSDLPIALLPADEFEQIFTVFGRKLALAHHYRCFKRPLSRDGRMFVSVETNAHMQPDLWNGLVERLPQLEIGRHGNEDLGSQIMTRWHANAEKQLAMFVTHIHNQLFIMGGTGEGDRWRKFVDEHGGGFAPFE